ncbi:MAG: arginine decarboxylase [Bacteroidota bacterium]|nr:arginine decarboxylase [Bacteroidota bacterium]
MKNRYIDLIDQTFYFPSFGFNLEEDNLTFYGIPLMELIEKYGTPLKLTYLPKIGEQIQKARKLFTTAMRKNQYNGEYVYCYCTKSSHFSFVINEVLKNKAQLETSSSFDMDIVRNCYEEKLINKKTYVLCNGYKTKDYIKKIADLINDGFENIIPILDSLDELDELEEMTKKPFQLGMRIAAEEEPNFEFYTSRLGIRYRDLLSFYEKRIAGNPKFKLKMLHFFINTGIKDDAYYWSELNKCINVYCDLKQVCPDLDSFDIGGGFPVPNSLTFDYDYEYMTSEIIQTIKNVCESNGVKEPNIFTEFGSYTVAESGAAIYKIIAEKQQNDAEKWYMIDSSFITTLPDTWGIGQRFIMLSVNQWTKEYQRVNLGGLTCDSQDYYNSETHINQVFLPKNNKAESLYIGFFHTGAYQESLGGYGGIQHCLIPAPKHILVDVNKKGDFTYKVFAKEQSAEAMMKILGFE